MENNIPWNIIVKFIQTQASPEEQLQLEKWLDEDKENRKVFNEIFNINHINGSSPKLLVPDKEKAWQNIDRQISKKVNPVLNFFNKFKYAAAIVVILVIGFLFLLEKNNNRIEQLLQLQTEIVSPMGHKIRVVLPDSSLVWMNSGSTLKYQTNFNLKEREVLLYGEAFFEVHENKSKIFRVKTGILNVDVYGTAFNIKNYDDDDFQEITVIEGRVGISDNEKEIRQLTVGENALLNKETKTIIFSETNPNVVCAWKNNELVFDNTPFEEVIKSLERWYGVHIAIDRAMIGKHNYTFKVKTESFHEMLEMMKVMTPLDYEINGEYVKIKYAN